MYVCMYVCMYVIHKGIHKNYFSEWKSQVMLSENEKIYTLENKLTCRSVKSIFREHVFLERRLCDCTY